MKSAKFNYKINHQINAQEVRAIGPDGKQIGILSLKDALERAREVNLDVVEIGPGAKPPVVKIVELGKFKYELEKKLRAEKKRSKPSELKEIRFTPYIAEHDFETRMERIEELLADKHKIKVVVVFKGLQMQNKKVGYDVIAKAVSRLEGRVSLDAEPKFIGRHLFCVISPVNKPMANVKKENEQLENKN